MIPAALWPGYMGVPILPAPLTWWGFNLWCSQANVAPCVKWMTVLCVMFPCPHSLSQVQAGRPFTSQNCMWPAGNTCSQGLNISEAMLLMSAVDYFPLHNRDQCWWTTLMYEMPNFWTCSSRHGLNVVKNTAAVGISCELLHLEKPKMRLS